jgi:ParB family chromosome partitioning protein
MITRDEMTKLYLVIPNIPKVQKIVQKISNFDSKLRKKYITALVRSPKASHEKLLQRAKAMQIKQNVSLHLSKTMAKKLAGESNRHDVTSDEMAGKIISNYLKHKKR